eukprot:64703_1
MDTFSTAHQDITTSNNAQTATVNKGNDYRNVYGSKAINANNKHIYKWTLKINQCNGWISVGIATKKDITADYNNQNYGYSNTASSRTFGNVTSSYGTTWTSGDTLEMIVDTDKKQISYTVNGKSQGKANDIDIGQQYYLVFTMNKIGDSVSIINSDLNSDIESKENEIKELKMETEKLKQNKTNLENQMASLQQQLKKCEGELKEKDKEIEQLRTNGKSEKTSNDNELSGDLAAIKAFFDSLPLPPYYGNAYCYSLICQGFTTLELFSSVTDDHLKGINCMMII